MTETTAIAQMTFAKQGSETTIMAQMKFSTAYNALHCLSPKDMIGRKWLPMYKMNLTLPELRNIIEEDFKKKIKKTYFCQQGFFVEVHPFYR